MFYFFSGINVFINASWHSNDTELVPEAKDVRFSKFLKNMRQEMKRSYQQCSLGGDINTTDMDTTSFRKQYTKHQQKKGGHPEFWESLS